MRIIITALLTLVLLPLWAQRRITREEYILRYKDLAIEKQDVYGIPASITMAQALLESDNGNSRLAVLANNHFGIKCRSEWKGQTITHDDDAEGECFRKYNAAEESYRDHSEFLDKSPRYQTLFNLDPTDYRGWAHGLKAAGYATNPSYAEMLIKIIEDNSLHLLDQNKPLPIETQQADARIMTQQQRTTAEKKTDGGPATKKEEPAIQTIDIDNYAIKSSTANGLPVYINNGSEFIIAEEGDTYESLGRSFGIPYRHLRKFSDADKDVQPGGGDMVYLKQKSKRSDNGNLIHVAKAGETLRRISQVYGIRLKSLARMNRLKPEETLHPGQQIRLM